jgi:hypothetical protein
MRIGRKHHLALVQRIQSSRQWHLPAGAAAFLALAMTRPSSAAFVSYQEDSQPNASFQNVATYIRNDKPTNSFGGDPQLLAGTISGSTGRIRALFAYDLRAAGGLSAGDTITDVSFALTVLDTDGNSVSRNVALEMHPLTGTITEGSGRPTAPSTNDATWNNRTTSIAWTTAGGDISSTVLASTTADPTAVHAGTVLTFSGSGTSNPLVQAAQAALDNPTSGIFEFAIKLPGGTSPGQEQGSAWELFLFQSDDNRDANSLYNAAVAPTLTITTATPTPEPTAAATLAMLAGGLLLGRRRVDAAPRDTGFPARARCV